MAFMACSLFTGDNWPVHWIVYGRLILTGLSVVGAAIWMRPVLVNDLPDRSRLP
jgi:hypothetical protein